MNGGNQGTTADKGSGLFLPCSISSSELLIITKLRLYATGSSMPPKRDMCTKLPHKRLVYSCIITQKHKKLQYFKERLLCINPKNH